MRKNELKIVTKGNKFDTRTKILWDNKDISKQVDQLIILMTKEKETEAIAVFKTKKLILNTKAVVKSETMIESIIKKVMGNSEANKKADEIVDKVEVMKSDDTNSKNTRDKIDK